MESDPIHYQSTYPSHGNCTLPQFMVTVLYTNALSTVIYPINYQVTIPNSWSLYCTQFMVTVLYPIHGHCTVPNSWSLYFIHFMVTVFYPIHGHCTLPNSWSLYFTQFMVTVLYPIHGHCTLPNSWSLYFTHFMVTVLYPIHSHCTVPNSWSLYCTQFMVTVLYPIHGHCTLPNQYQGTLPKYGHCRYSIHYHVLCQFMGAVLDSKSLIHVYSAHSWSLTIPMVITHCTLTKTSHGTLYFPQFSIRYSAKFMVNVLPAQFMVTVSPITV